MLVSIKTVFLNLQFWLRLALAFLFPYLFFSALMILSANAVNEALEGDGEMPELAIVGQQHIPSELLQKYKDRANVVFLNDKNEITLKLASDSIDAGLVFSKDFSSDSNFIRQVDCYYNSMKNSKSLNMIVDVLDTYEDEIIAENADSLGLDESVFNPVSINKNNSFSVFNMVADILNQVKGVSAGIINFLFVMFVVWLLRSLILRVERGQSPSFVYNLIFIFAASLMAMVLVFIGFQSGINNSSQGIIKSLVFGIQQLLQWKKVSAVFWLWLPTWLFIIGVLGCLASFAKTSLKAYSFTFWGAVILHIVAIAGLFPLEKISLSEAIIPVYNIFCLGQLTLKEALLSSDWWIAFVAVSLCALFANVLWYKIKKRSDRESINAEPEIV